jgi:hypothetical protein
MHYITSMAKTLWARSIHFFFSCFLLAEWVGLKKNSIVVEFAKESRPRRDPYEDRYGYSLIIRREMLKKMLMVS